MTLYLVSTTELYQLLKIPDLIEHYCEHKTLNPEMSLTAFLKTHYDHPVKDSDYKNDQKLPFVVHSAPLILFFTLEKGFTFEIKNEHLPAVHSKKIPFSDIDFCYKGFLNSVWEPPRSLYS